MGQEVGPARQRYRETAYARWQDAVPGRALLPVRCGRDLLVGGGQVFPEINFTLPPMAVNAATLPEAVAQFRQMAEGCLDRAAALHVPGVVLELEHVFEFTAHPAWGEALTTEVRAVLDLFHQQHGIPCAMRVTVADIRDRVRPPRRRGGPELEAMLESFRRCAAAGADILSIESTGGKEVSDPGITACDLPAVLLAVGVLGSRDVAFLWRHITAIAQAHGRVPGGDTDCAHANTAMRLADMGYVPEVFAALVRAVAAARSLVAFECGARGPSKDCGYEGVVTKLVTGTPISMEGKTSACAHSSPMGNVAAALADLWSNESVQNVRLLGGQAPVVMAEMLTYDCRLFNVASAAGHGALLRDLLTRSDAALSPQAFVLAPEVAFDIARAIVSAPKDGDPDYGRSRRAAAVAAERLAAAAENGQLSLSEREARWLDRFRRALDALPASLEELWSSVAAEYPDTFLPEEYPAGD